ncbi:MAG: PadR family transcriptional regulator [Haloarculaceae archaeon]
MTGDDLKHATAGEAGDERLTPLIGTLDPNPSPGSIDCTTLPDRRVASVAAEVSDGSASVADDLVTQSLDAILLALIAVSDEQTHGTGLMDELDRLFDADLSPGTVYPRLHELEADGVLNRHDLVQTKQYSISDDDAAEDLIERAAREHLAISLFLHAALE